MSLQRTDNALAHDESAFVNAERWVLSPGKKIAAQRPGRK